MGGFRYFSFGLHIESDLDPGQFSHPVSAQPDVRIRVGSVPAVQATAKRLEHRVESRGIGTFLIRDGSEIVVDLDPGVSPDVARVLLNGRLMAYLLWQRGWYPLHGSSVQMGTGAVIFIASAGTGKSTMAAGLVAHGYTVLSDDVSPVQVVSGVCLLQPGHAKLRLCDDAATAFGHLDPARTFLVDKYEFQLRVPETTNCVPVTRIYLLEDGGGLALEAVPPIEALRALARHCFVRLQGAAPDVRTSHLRHSGALVNSGLVRKLIRPKRFDVLDEVIRLVESDLGLL